jgi:dienelactone hydrolase
MPAPKAAGKRFFEAGQQKKRKPKTCKKKKNKQTNKHTNNQRNKQLTKNGSLATSYFFKLHVHVLQVYILGFCFCWNLTACIISFCAACSSSTGEEQTEN